MHTQMQIWDTAGQERFRAMAPMYYRYVTKWSPIDLPQTLSDLATNHFFPFLTYRNAAAAIVCFDITDEQSFEMMKDWVDELKKNVPEGKLIIAIACTKADLDARRVSHIIYIYIYPTM